MPAPLLVVLLGPTASGKTAAAVALARHFRTCVVSADSRQLYKEIPAGTAQPSAEEQQGVPHFFIASHSIHDAVDAGRYSREARAVLDKEFATHPVILLAGGSGLYIDALIDGFDELPVQDSALRKELQRKFEEEGIAALQDELKQLDPEHFAQVDVNNPVRLIRAIEVCRVTGKKYSELRSKPGRTGSRTHTFPYRVLKIGLEWPREELYARINKRVEEMMRNGLEAEARAVHPYRSLNALQTVGYKELFDYFEGRTSLEKAVELIRQHTRNFARRQMTWWRKDKEIHWFRAEDVEGMKELIAARLKN